MLKISHTLRLKPAAGDSSSPEVPTLNSNQLKTESIPLEARILEVALPGGKSLIRNTIISSDPGELKPFGSKFSQQELLLDLPLDPVGQKLPVFARTPGFNVQMAGLVSYASEQPGFKSGVAFPIYKVTMGDLSDLTKKLVVITAGIHGDEHAPVLAALRFLEDYCPRFAANFSFVVFPCVNPSGLRKFTRANGDEKDVNRSFKTGGIGDFQETQESKILNHELSLLPRCPDLLIDAHQDNPDCGSNVAGSASGSDPKFPLPGLNPPPAYDGSPLYPEDFPPALHIYESCYAQDGLSEARLRVSHNTLGTLGEFLPVLGNNVVYGDLAYSGVIMYPQSIGGPSAYQAASDIEGSVAKMGILNSSSGALQKVPLALTIETPLTWTAEQQVLAEMAAIVETLCQVEARDKLAPSLSPAEKSALFGRIKREFLTPA